MITYPDELLYDAVVKMIKHDIGRLPVVNRKLPHQLVDYLGRSSVLKALRRHIEKEHEREPGWLTRFAPTATDETDANYEEHRQAA